MANWSNPTLTSLYTDFLSELKARDEDLAKQFDGQTVSNLITGTIRWSSSANRWQKWTGSAWGELTTTYALTGLSTTGNATIGGTLGVTGAATLSGGGTSTTPATADNSTAIATTAYVKAQAYATLASPALSGTPTAPTAALNTNTTQIATTAFVIGQGADSTPLMAGTAAVGTSLEFARGDHVHPTDTSRAPLASPTFTGTPAAPTAAVGTNTTQLATTAFVQAEIANDAPAKDGTGATGTWAISVTGNAGTATTLATARTINGVSFNGSANITVTANTPQALTAGSFLTSTGAFDGSTARTFAVDATSANTASKVVARDASGNFSAGTITANLTGTASGNLPLTGGGTLTGTITFAAANAAAGEGGEFYLAKPSTGSLAGNVGFDIYTNSLRIFENGGSFRGVTVDLTGCGSQSVLLHSNNYNSYVPTLTGGGASGTWGISITGNSATTSGCTFPNDAFSKDDITTRTDSGFYQTSTGTTAEGWPTNSNGWHHLISCTHSNDSNYFAMQIAARFDTQDWYFRNTNASGTQAWSTMLHSGNYNSYSPTLTGTGASGTWGINITGNAATVSNGAYTNANNTFYNVRQYFSNPSPNHDVWGTPIEIREVGLVGNTQTTNNYAPGIMFHWSNVAASAIKMFSDGSIRSIALANTGSPVLYRDFYASSFIGEGLKVFDEETDGTIPTAIKLGRDGVQYTTFYGNASGNRLLSVSTAANGKDFQIRVTDTSTTGVYTFARSGTLTATAFSGDGSALTSLNGSNISSGTVSSARLPNASVSAAGIVTTGTQTFAGDKQFTGTAYANNTSLSAATTAGRWVLSATGEAFFARDDSGSNLINLMRNNDGNVVRMIRGTTGVGSITVTASATAYNTSSDYRLKENITPLSGALDRLKLIPVHRFNFIVEPDRVVDGFLAHEVQEFVPEAVTGTKDAMQAIGTITDADGTVLEENVPEPSSLPDGHQWSQTGEQPDYQGIDQAKLVPLLTAAVQELLARIEALESA